MKKSSYIFLLISLILLGTSLSVRFLQEETEVESKKFYLTKINNKFGIPNDTYFSILIKGNVSTPNRWTIANSSEEFADSGLTFLSDSNNGNFITDQSIDEDQTLINITGSAGYYKFDFKSSYTASIDLQFLNVFPNGEIIDYIFAELKIADLENIQTSSVQEYEILVSGETNKIKVNKNSKFNIRVPGNNSTGYRWVVSTNVDELLENGVALLTDGVDGKYIINTIVDPALELETDIPVPGSSGYFVFEFLATKTGEVDIEFEYLPPFEQDIANLKAQVTAYIVDGLFQAPTFLLGKIVDQEEMSPNDNDSNIVFIPDMSNNISLNNTLNITLNNTLNDTLNNTLNDNFNNTSNNTLNNTLESEEYGIAIPNEYYDIQNYNNTDNNTTVYNATVESKYIQLFSNLPNKKEQTSEVYDVVKGTTITVYKDEFFILRFNGIPTTGYLWTLTNDLKSLKKEGLLVANDKKQGVFNKLSRNEINNNKNNNNKDNENVISEEKRKEFEEIIADLRKEENINVDDLYGSQGYFDFNLYAKKEGEYYLNFNNQSLVDESTNDSNDLIVKLVVLDKDNKNKGRLSRFTVPTPTPKNDTLDETMNKIKEYIKEKKQSGKGLRGKFTKVTEFKFTFEEEVIDINM